MLLVRITVGKIKDIKRLESIFRQIPIRSAVEGWNCVAWVKEALEAALRDKKALGTTDNIHWNMVRDTAMWYVEQKKAAHRFDGKVQYDHSKAATWNMLEGCEQVP